MRKQERRAKILEILLNHPGGMTGADLARRLDVSSRTVRSDIKYLQERLAESRCALLAAPNRGYKLQGAEGEEDLLRLIDGDDAGIGISHPKERRNYIVSRFLECCLTNVSVTQMGLANEMYVGLSTVKNYLNAARERFAAYDLKIAQYKTEGLRLEGAEGDLRAFIVDYLHEVTDEKLCGLLFDRIGNEAMEQILTQTASVRHLQLTDTARRDLSVQTALAIRRSSAGHAADCLSSTAQKLEETFEYGAAKEVANEIFRYTGIDVPYSEVFYITQCLLTGKKLMDIGSTVNDAHVKELVEKVLDAVDRKFGLDFTADEYLKDGLMLHLRIAIARVRFRMNIRNELLASVKQDYPLAFQIAVYAAKMVREIDHIDFDENEIGYIALHFGASMSRNSMDEDEQPKSVYIVCSAGLGVSVLMKAKLEEHFRGSIHVIGVLPAYKLTEDMLEEADYIVSAVPLDMSSPKIIRVNHMLRGEDVDKIRRVMFRKQDVLDAETVRQFFRKKGFYADMAFRTQAECLDFLTDEAVAAGWMDAEGKASVFERERMSSTAIGALAAIPHALSAACKVSNISVLILKRPIQWEDMPVRVVFLLNIEQEKAALWEKIFLKLYEYIKTEHGIDSLLKHQSYERFLEEFTAVL
ncbi:BglG family transcription antiterminator [Selenomonas sp. F0473]|uniref:BglG family transcription antiterminator n=1 Tax=Selenomonas sp. F0473 TaxID=999423 RepID=UPI0025DB9D64|nr:BglG family transcription antiterminator [Selenomonas sp. F0473]